MTFFQDNTTLYPALPLIGKCWPNFEYNQISFLCLEFSHSLIYSFKVRPRFSNFGQCMVQRWNNFLGPSRYEICHFEPFTSHQQDISRKNSHTWVCPEKRRSKITAALFQTYTVIVYTISIDTHCNIKSSTSAAIVRQFTAKINKQTRNNFQSAYKLKDSLPHLTRVQHFLFPILLLIFSLYTMQIDCQSVSLPLSCLVSIVKIPQQLFCLFKHAW